MGPFDGECLLLDVIAFGSICIWISIKLEVYRNVCEWKTGECKQTKTQQPWIEIEWNECSCRNLNTENCVVNGLMYDQEHTVWIGLHFEMK